MNKTTYELITLLTGAINEGNQTKINIYAYELTARLYVPGIKQTFDEILEGFGYREINNERQISIEEYVEGKEEDERGRKRN